MNGQAKGQISDKANIINNIFFLIEVQMIYTGGSEAKNPHAMQETGSILGMGRSPGEGNGNPLQYSCLENLMDRRAQWATVHGIAELDTTQ